MYSELRLTLLSGQTLAIGVHPPFSIDDLDYYPGIRAVSLGNLTVLYEGIIYEVRPGGRVVGYGESPVQRLKRDPSRPN